MSVRRILILMVAIISIFIANTGVGVATHSMLINSNNTTASYTNLDIAYEKSVSYSDASSTSLIYSTFASVPPTIDGSLSYGEWGEPAIIDTLSYTNDSINYETHDMYVYFMNDNSYLYIATQIINDDFETEEAYIEGKDMDSFTIYFDGDNDEIFESGEDVKQFSNLEYDDWYYWGDDCTGQDETLDGDGAASHSNHALGDYTYEFKIPLNSGDVHDFAITPDSTIGLKIVYSESYYDSSEGYWICDGNSDSWPNDEDTFDATNYGKLKLSSSSSSDTTPPSLTITSPPDGSTVTTQTITVSGTATDATGVSSLTVNSNAVTLESDGSFTTTISLTSGENIITVVATDATGNTATQSITVTYTPSSITGDLNNNGILDTGDVTLVLRMAVGLTTPDLLGDMNSNGIIDTGDATLILREIVGLE